MNLNLKGVIKLGDQTELMLEGFICFNCGEYLDGDDPGFPRNCEACQQAKEKALARQRKSGKEKPTT